MMLVRSGNTFKDIDKHLASDTIRQDCCITSQISDITPDTDTRIPSFCTQCGNTPQSYIDPERDRIERLSLAHNLTFDVAEFLYKAFRASDYVSFSAFLDSIKTNGLTPAAFYHKSTRDNPTTKDYNHQKREYMQAYHVRLTITCKDCLTTFRITALLPSSYIQPKHCVLCGSTTIRAYNDSEADYNEVIAESYDTDTDTIKLLIDCFGRSGHEHFASFVQENGGVNNLAALCKVFVKTGMPSFHAFIEGFKAMSKSKGAK